LNQNQQKIKLLLQKPVWSLEDQLWLLSILESDGKDELTDVLNTQFFNRLSENVPTETPRFAEILSKLHEKINSNLPKNKSVLRLNIQRLAIAASLLVLVYSGYFMLASQSKKQTQTVVAEQAKNKSTPILPGSNKATLTLADGTVVLLDDTSTGTIANQSKVDISKINNGSVVYKGVQSANELIFNTITTPRGGKFQIILADGTSVWLNASSSLRFPVQFVGAERKVELSGEGYFEVTENKNQPFVVVVPGKQSVTVLGTHFNINAYTDEMAIKTTLLNGNVVVGQHNSAVSQKLIPGQQCHLTAGGQFCVLSGVDTEEIIAWKNNKFDFGETMEIKSVMRQIERWYDIEVEYQGDVSEVTLGGSISRDVNAQKVFEMLELTGAAHFNVKNGKVIISPMKSKNLRK
jgi:transmembrane sensor